MERATTTSGVDGVKEIEIRLRVSTGMLKAGFIALLAALPATELASESVTLTTYYPAPSGIYAQMITTGNTQLAKDGGTVSVGGLLKVASLSADPAGVEGAIFYSTTRKTFMGFSEGAWQPLGSAGKPIVCSAFRDPGTSHTTGWNYALKFTAAECGGKLPDDTYVAAVKSAKMCNGIEHFHALNAGEDGPGSNYFSGAPNIKGPGIVMWFSDFDKDGDGPCQWPEYGGARMQATVVYIKAR